jgi:hypothetical protein
MSDSFDPYYIWLGIPPKDQPPNHYRLLSLQDLEENTDVIDAAANRQTSYLHEMAAGPRRKESQQLLNEVAAARRCLLSPEKKQEYDDKLRADQTATEAAQAAAIPVARSVAPTVPLIDAGATEVAGIPAFDFSGGGAASPESSVDVGIVVSDSQHAAPTASAVQSANEATSNASGDGSESPAKKPIPKQLIIAGCSIAVAAIVAFVFANGSTPETKSKSKSKSVGTSTRLDGKGSAVRGNSASSVGKNATDTSEDGDSNADNGRLLFDMKLDSDNVFHVPSGFGGKKKQKKKK